MEIGKYNELRVKSIAEIGLYLTDGSEDVLLPKRYVPEGAKAGDEMEVFVYLDNDDRPVATTLKAKAAVGDFAFLTVKQVNQHGAFLDWGIAKDVFVPYAEQRVPMEEGRSYLVYLFIDDRSGRIAATSKWSQYIESTDELEPGEEVQLLIAEQTNLGYRAIINNLYEGLLYQNEVFGEIHPGDLIRGFVKQIRDDGKVDLRLQAPGYEHILNARDLILHQLQKNGGRLALGDKSPTEDIYREFKISKKAFKKAIGGLYKERLIVVGDREIVLVVND